MADNRSKFNTCMIPLAYNLCTVTRFHYQKLILILPKMLVQTSMPHIRHDYANAGIVFTCCNPNQIQHIVMLPYFQHLLYFFKEGVHIITIKI